MHHLLAVLKQTMKNKKLEEMLFQSENLKSIGAITAGITHEFSNILAIIFSNVELLEETYKDYGELVEGLRTIKQAARDGVQISNKLLKITKTNEGTTEFVSFNIVELLQHAIDFTMPKWKNIAQSKGLISTWIRKA